MKKIILIILCCLLCLCCSHKLSDNCRNNMNNAYWSGWYKDNDSINHNVLCVPINDSISVKILEVSY